MTGQFISHFGVRVTEIEDTPILARPYCPGCEPEADTDHEILSLRWCDTHYPSWDGVGDEKATTSAYLCGTTEAGGDANRQWCE